MSSSPVPHPRAGPPFECSSSTNDDGAVHIRLSGELDVATTAEVKAALDDALARARDAVVDLRCLEFMDTRGVHALVEATLAARREAQRVVVVAGPPNVHAIFELTGTDDCVEIIARPLRAA